jgi:hypothetical protein
MSNLSASATSPVGIVISRPPRSFECVVGDIVVFAYIDGIAFAL